MGDEPAYHDRLSPGADPNSAQAEIERWDAPRTGDGDTVAIPESLAAAEPLPDPLDQTAAPASLLGVVEGPAEPGVYLTEPGLAAPPDVTHLHDPGDPEQYAGRDVPDPWDTEALDAIDRGIDAIASVHDVPREALTAGLPDMRWTAPVDEEAFRREREGQLGPEGSDG